MSNSSYEQLLREARDDRQRLRPVEQSPGALLLVSCLFVPTLLLNLFPALATYFLLLAPAFPLIVLVLGVQMREHWRRPEIAVALSVLAGFALGFLLLFVQNWTAILAHFGAASHALP